MTTKRVWLGFDVRIENDVDDHKMFLENYINRTNQLPPYDAPSANLKLVSVKVEEVVPPAQRAADRIVNTEYALSIAKPGGGISKILAEIIEEEYKIG